MAAVSLSWNTDMTAVTSCEKALQVKKESNPYKVFKIFAKHKFDTRDQSVCKRRVKVFQFSSGNHQDPYCSSVFFKLYTSQQTSPTSCSFRTESFPLWINGTQSSTRTKTVLLVYFILLFSLGEDSYHNTKLLRNRYVPDLF